MSFLSPEIISNKVAQATYRISFSVSTIECITCTPVFKRELVKVRGVKKVEPLVMLNIIDVDIDPEITNEDEIKRRILEIAERFGYGGKDIFRKNPGL